MKPPRLFYIDNIRAFLIILVIYIHSAVTYSGMGSWYYVENKSIDALSFVVMGFIQSWTQAYFMGTLFFIAGYFAVSSLGRKGKGRFIWDRFIRLGVPTILYILILNYLCFYLLGYAANYGDYLMRGLDNLLLLSWTGPMWFALLLLIFSVIYALAGKPGAVQSRPIKNIPLIILILALATFLTRIYQPIDSSILNMQLPYFPQYITLFILGIIGYKRDWLAQPSKEDFAAAQFPPGGKVIKYTLIIGLILWTLTITLSGVLDGRMDFKGGLNAASLAYCLWESITCIGITIGLLSCAREKYNKQTKTTKFLTDNSFAAYVLHPPILIGISLLMIPWNAPPIPKFLIIGTMAVIATFLVAGMIRKTPMKRIL